MKFKNNRIYPENVFMEAVRTKSMDLVQAKPMDLPNYVVCYCSIVYNNKTIKKTKNIFKRIKL